MKDLIKKHRNKLVPIGFALILSSFFIPMLLSWIPSKVSDLIPFLPETIIFLMDFFLLLGAFILMVAFVLDILEYFTGEDSKRNKIKKILEGLPWILLIIGFFITSSPLRISASVFGALLIVCFMLLGGYFMKIIEPLTDTWKRAILSFVFLIILNGILMEWAAVNFSTESHQTGWEFAGMIMLMYAVIPIAASLALIIEAIRYIFKKFIPSHINAFLGKISIKVFFWVAVITLIKFVGPIWINSSSSWS